ncbi:hypothetical protein [Candidatus Nitrospira salsa]
MGIINYHKLLIKYFILLIIPLCTAFIAVQVRNVTTPYFLLNYDPDYAYLFNSLNIIDFLSPAYVDHPGTPVQLLGALVIKFIHPFESSIEIMKAVIQNPEIYLFSISNALIALNIIALFAAGVVFFQKTNRVELGILVQASPLLFPITVTSLGRVTPEPLLIFVSTILTCLIGFTMNSNQATDDPKLVKAFGWIAGLGIATKLTFFPILFMPIALFRSISTLKLYVRYLIGGAFVFTSVFLLYPKIYYSFLRWIFNLVMGSGIYGQGKRTVIAPQKYLSDLGEVVLAQPMYLIIIALTIFAYLINFRGLRELHKHSFLLLWLIVIHFLALGIVAKHPQSLRYLIPSFGLSGITLVIAILSIESAFRHNKSHIWLFQTSAIVAGIAMSAFSVNQIASTIDELQIQKNVFGTEIAQRNKLVEEKYSHCIQAHQDSSTQTFGRFFGLQWSRQSFARQKFLETMPTEKQSFSYDPNQKVFFKLGGGKIPLEEIRKSASCIIRLTHSGTIERL